MTWSGQDDCTVANQLLTEEELLALGADARVEIVNGEIVHMPPAG